MPIRVEIGGSVAKMEDRKDERDGKTGGPGIWISKVKRGPPWLLFLLPTYLFVEVMMNCKRKNRDDPEGEFESGAILSLRSTSTRWAIKAQFFFTPFNVVGTVQGSPASPETFCPSLRTRPTSRLSWQTAWEAELTEEIVHAHCPLAEPIDIVDV